MSNPRFLATKIEKYRKMHPVVFLTRARQTNISNTERLTDSK